MPRTIAAALALVTFACATTTSAQTATLSRDLVTDWQSQRQTMLRIADAMPEDRFDFAPTAEQRTYAEQILHIAGANVMLMGHLGAAATAPAIDPTDFRVFGHTDLSKAAVLRALSESYDYGLAALREFDDEALLATIDGPPYLGRVTRTKMIYFTLGHTLDIYGQLAVYLRLEGIVPPASRRGGI